MGQNIGKIIIALFVIIVAVIVVRFGFFATNKAISFGANTVNNAFSAVTGSDQKILGEVDTGDSGSVKGVDDKLVGGDSSVSEDLFK